MWVLSEKTNIKTIAVSVALATLALSGCSGGGSDEDKEVQVNPGYITDTETYWENYLIAKPKRNGVMNPFFDAKIDSDKNIHVVYYSLSQDRVTDTDVLYDINYGIFNTSTQEFTAHSSAPVVATVENSDRISLDLDGQGVPHVVYRGGNKAACIGGTVQGDTMISVLTNNAWQEYTGAIGFVERSSGPLTDGRAGGVADLAIDPQTNKAHFTYQFFYEGCDATNFAFPDLFYVGKLPSELANDARSAAQMEEQVSGNDGSNGGTFQNTTGDVSDIVVNVDGQPLVFYYSKATSNGMFGLYMGVQKEPDVWGVETIHEACEIEDVAASIAKNGDIHVAYIVRKNCKDVDEEWTLMHAYRKAITADDITNARYNNNPSNTVTEYSSEAGPVWQKNYVWMVPKIGGLGRHLSMVMNKNDLPQIAYYELENFGAVSGDLRNLATVELTPQGEYLKKQVARWDDIGTHSKMITDADGEIYILSYVPPSQDLGDLDNPGEIHLFVEGINGSLSKK